MGGNAESATRRLARFCRTGGYWCLLRALVRRTNFVAVSLILCPSIAASEEHLDGSVSELFERIKTKPVELRHFLQNFPKGGDLHSHLSGAVYAESYLELASERDLCVDLKSKVLSKPPCDPIQNRIRKLQPINRCTLHSILQAGVRIWAGSILLNFPKIFPCTRWKQRRHACGGGLKGRQTKNPIS